MSYAQYMQVYEVIREHGPITTADVKGRVPDIPPQTINGAICRLTGSKIQRAGRDGAGRTLWEAIA